MHSLLGLAGLLGLIAMAFGKRAAEVTAAVILMAGTVVMLFFAYMIIFEKL